MDWKKKTMLFYIIGGLACGIIAGMITINNAVENDKEIDLSLQEGAKIGMNAIKLLTKTVIK